MTKRKRKKPAAIEREDVTPERAAKNGFTSAGMAVQETPVINDLRAAKMLTDEEWIALHYYRMRALQALDDERNESPLSPDNIMGGVHHSTMFGGAIPKGMITTPAKRETADIEKKMGIWRDTARAIAVENKTPTRYCIERYGGRERYEDGRCVGIAPRLPHMVKTIRLELQCAAGTMKYCRAA